jgi:hypothetical protein
MKEEATNGEPLPIYRVRARNIAADSDNRIHDDRVAQKYGFRGGLVPGVTIYAYMTVPIVARYCHDWLERGSMQVKFHLPFYEGDEVIVRAEVDSTSDPIKVAVTAEREDGAVCATALATINDQAAWLGEPRLEDYPEIDLLPDELRPEARPGYLVKGSRLGTLKEKLDLKDTTLLEGIAERLPVYYGPDKVAHPMALLALANHILMRNFKLGPWIHTASDLINWSAARDGEEISVRGRIADCYERKGHNFVVLNLLLLADEARVVQQVRHTAIYRPRIT